MAITLLYKSTRAKIGSIELDASISEQHQAEVEVTDSPVEEGVSVSDHARPKPEVLIIEGLITNTPIPDPTTDLTRRSFQSTLNAVSVEFDSRGEIINGRAEGAYQDLLDLKNKGELIQVVTGLRTYENMVLTSLNVPRDAKTGQAIRFTASFRQVKVVQNGRIEIARTEPKTKPKRDLGKKPSKDANEETEKESWARAGKNSKLGKKVLNFFGGLGN